MKVTFGTSVLLPSTKTSDDLIDVIVTADVTPGERAGLHCPASGPIPEIETVIIDPCANVDGTRYERGEDVTLLLGLKDMQDLEDKAIGKMVEDEMDKADEEPPERDVNDYGE